MSDAENVETEGQEPSVETEDANEPSIQELMKSLDEIRKAQKGSDRKVKELSDALTSEKSEKQRLQEQLEAAETEKMSDKEKAAHERQKFESQMAEREAALEKKEREAWFSQALVENSLTKEQAHLMRRPTNDEELAEWIEAYNSIVKPAIQKGVTESLINSGGTPKTGDQPARTVDYTSPEERKRVLSMKPGPEKDAAILEMVTAAGSPTMGA